MAEYKLIAALPQSAPGNTEDHYGYKCEVRSDGIYVKLDDVTAENFLNAGRIKGPIERKVKVVGPVVEPEAAPVVEPVEPTVEPEAAPTAEEKPQTMKEVIENGSGKRGPKPQAK
jgi:hypothetical protein